MVSYGKSIRLQGRCRVVTKDQIPPLSKHKTQLECKPQLETQFSCKKTVNNFKNMSSDFKPVLIIITHVYKV